MDRVNKVDYFVGVFISSILKSKSAKGAPALFDETSESKRVQFETDLGYFNVYVKYSMSLKNRNFNINGSIKNKMSCDVPFYDNDYNILKDQFLTDSCRNYIALVCSCSSLSETKIAVLPYEDAMKCLKYKTQSGSRRITVTRIGSEYHFNCYGVSGPDFPKGQYVYSHVNFMRYFDKEAQNEPEEE